MRITSIDVTSVVVPMKPNSTNSAVFGERPFQLEPIHILEVHTDAGVTGIGETPRNLPRTVIEDGIGKLMGQDPLALNLQQIASLEGNRAYNGFEMALVDLVGKALGVPAYVLLGGAYRKRIWVSYWTGTRTPDDLARIGRQAVAAGFTALKCKCRWGEPYAAQMQALEEAVPELDVVCDFNTDLRRPVEAERLADRVSERNNILAWEDPVPHVEWRWYRHLRSRISIPIAPHLGQASDLVLAIEAGAIDYANLAGGMFAFQRMAAIADAAGIPCWHGAGIELGIATAANLHACAAAKGCTLPSDIWAGSMREDDLIVEELKVAGSCVSLPEGQGLGVTLDREALARYSVS